LTNEYAQNKVKRILSKEVEDLLAKRFVFSLISFMHTSFYMF